MGIFHYKPSSYRGNPIYGNLHEYYALNIECPQGGTQQIQPSRAVPSGEKTSAILEALHPEWAKTSFEKKVIKTCQGLPSGKLT